VKRAEYKKKTIRQTLTAINWSDLLGWNILQLRTFARLRNALSFGTIFFCIIGVAKSVEAISSISLDNIFEQIGDQS
jgi:hypothetical protein